MSAEMTVAASAPMRTSRFDRYLRGQSAVLGVIAASALVVLMLATVLSVLALLVRG